MTSLASFYPAKRPLAALRRAALLLLWYATVLGSHFLPHYAAMSDCNSTGIW